VDGRCPYYSDMLHKSIAGAGYLCRKRNDASGSLSGWGAGARCESGTCQAAVTPTSERNGSMADTPENFQRPFHPDILRPRLEVSWRVLEFQEYSVLQPFATLRVNGDALWPVQYSDGVRQVQRPLESSL